MTKYLKITTGATTHYLNVNCINSLQPGSPSSQKLRIALQPNLTKYFEITGTGFTVDTQNAVVKELKAAAVSDYTKVVHEVKIPVGQTFTSVAIV